MRSHGPITLPEITPPMRSSSTSSKRHATLTKLLDNRLQLIQISLVLPDILHLLLDSLEDPHRRGIVVDLTSRPQSGSDDLRGGDEIVREAVVEPTLELKEVSAGREKRVVAVVEGFEGLGFVGVRAGAGVEADAWG